MKKKGKPFIFTLFLVFPLLLNACSWVDIPQVAPLPPESQKPANTSKLVELEFIARLPSPVETGQSVALEVLDEVTGLAFNPTRMKMNAQSADTFSLKLTVNAGSVIKYRYVRDGNIPVYEYNSLGKQVRYRMVLASAPAVIHDTITAWSNLPYDGPYGRIVGRILDQETGEPVSPSLVTICGQETISSSDGTFTIDHLPPGIHNLVVYSLDGSYPVFQQEAEVAENSATPADIRIPSASFSEVTFIAIPPSGSLMGLPIRLVGNTYPLGNTYANLRGGMNVLASRAPLLKLREDGKYEIKLRLPVGLDLRYKYTIGDGFWNAERDGSGQWITRQLIVPSTPATVEDQIASWSSPGKGSVTFRVEVPGSTPPGETISIQFNPYGWTEPIPMWPLGNNRWLFILYSPLDMIGETSYRICRNEQCGIADDIQTKGTEGLSRSFTPQPDSQVFEIKVAEWNWMAGAIDPVTVPGGSIPQKPESFMTAIELVPDYHPSWQPYFTQAFESISKINANRVILSPTWHYSGNIPPMLQLVAGVDASWYDISEQINLAKQKGLAVAVHPTTSLDKPALLWWNEAPRDSNWWQTWFDRYEAFLLHHADLAQRNHAEILIFGETNILPAFPNGILPDGRGSNSPGDAELRWRNLISKVRERFKGQIGWFLPYPEGFKNIPPFLNEVDQLYVLLEAPLNSQDTPGETEISSNVEHLLETDLRSLRDRFDKPMILGIAYPSVRGAASGCIRSADACLPATVFYQGGLEIPSVETDLRTQAVIYNAILHEISRNDWLAGVFSAGFYPPVGIADQSVSINGKPAADVLWFWFNQFHPK